MSADQRAPQRRAMASVAMNAWQRSHLGVAHGGGAHEATRPRLLERRLGGRISGCSAARHWDNRLSPGTPGKPIALEIGFKANNQFAFGIGFEAKTNSTVESVSRRTPVGLEIGFKPKTNRSLWREPAAKRQMGKLGFTRLDARSWSYTRPGTTSDPSDLPFVGLVDCRLGEKIKTDYMRKTQ